MKLSVNLSRALLICLSQAHPLKLLPVGWWAFSTCCHTALPQSNLPSLPFGSSRELLELICCRCTRSITRACFGQADFATKQKGAAGHTVPPDRHPGCCPRGTLSFQAGCCWDRLHSCARRVEQQKCLTRTAFEQVGMEGFETFMQKEAGEQALSLGN